MDIEKQKQLIIDALEDIKGQDIQVLDVSEITSISDYMIIASGTSSRQVRSLAQNVIEECKKNNVNLLGSEGQEKAEWVLVDAGDIIVHIMQAETRDFYQLEKLWSMPEDKDQQESQE